MTASSAARRRFPGLCLRGMVAVCLGWLIVGCQPPPDPFLDLADATTGALQVDDLQSAFELISSQRSFEQRELDEKVTLSLNRWTRRVLESSDAASLEGAPWSPAPPLQALNERFAHLALAGRAGELGFLPTDPFYLRTRYELNQLSQRVTENQSLIPYGFYREVAHQLSGEQGDVTGLVDCFQRLHPALSAEEAAQLAAAFQLFDWVVRNIQLEEPAQIPREEWDAVRLSEEPQEDAARAGIRGLGYRRLVGQVLLYGRGDYVERAKLFLALCDQHNIPAVLLSIGEQPWAVGVLIGDDVYLFDTRLGLPIPGAQVGEIATVAGVRAQPELLTGLDLSIEESTRSDVKYWVRPEQLESLQSGIWLTPESTSRRMRFLEDRLVGALKLKITTDVGAVATRCQQVLGSAPSWLDWEYRTHDFRQTFREALARSTYDDELRQRLEWYFLEEYYVDAFNMYRTARHLFIVGRFAVERDSRRLSAIEYFYNLMYTDEMIDGLALNETLLRRVGILQAQQSTAEFQASLRSTQQNMRIVRRDVSLFLSQALFDNNNWGTAENWLTRIIQQPEMDRWKPGIEYLLARARESVRDYPAALQLWRRQDGPQFHGNLVRARLVQQASTPHVAAAD